MQAISEKNVLDIKKRHEVVEAWDNVYSAIYPRNPGEEFYPQRKNLVTFGIKSK